MALTVAGCLLPPPPPPPAPLPDFAGEVGPDREHCGGGDALCVQFVDDLGKLYVPQQVDVFVDDTLVFSRVATEPQTAVVVYSGDLGPGEHDVGLRFRFLGLGHLQGYKFEMKSHHRVRLTEDTPIELVARVYRRRGGVPLENQPMVSWTEPSLREP